MATFSAMLHEAHSHMMVGREPQRDFDFDDFYAGANLYEGDEHLENDLDLDDPAWGGWNHDNEPWRPYEELQEQHTTANGEAGPSRQHNQRQPPDAQLPQPTIAHETVITPTFASVPTSTKRKAAETFDDSELSGRVSKEKRVSRLESDEPGSASSLDGSAPAEPQQVQQKKSNKGTGPEGRERDLTSVRPVAGPRPTPVAILDSGQYYTIEVGSKSFPLSRASLSSDSPSYFTDYFKKRRFGLGDGMNTLRLDGDPATFSLIVQHLQGLHVIPENEVQYARLFTYARDYRLRALLEHLYKSDLFVRVGNTQFRIPRELFKTPGDSTNYFQTFHSEFFAESELRRFESTVGRGPRIQPATVPYRDGRLFGELLGLLGKQEVEIRSAAHRKELFKEANFYKFHCLEQRLVPCDISYNTETAQTEIVIPLEHMRKSGLSYTPDKPPNDSSPRSARATNSSTPGPGPDNGIPSGPVTMTYARPLVDNHALANILIVEIPNPEMTLHFPFTSSTVPMEAGAAPVLHLRATFYKETLRFMVNLFKTISSKLGLSVTQPLGLMMLDGGGVKDQPLSPATSGISEDRVRVRISEECYMEVDGEPVELGIDSATSRPGIRAGPDWIWGGIKAEEQEYTWIINKGQWKVRVEPVSDGGQAKWEVVLCGVQVSACTNQKNRNRARGFLDA